MLIIGNIERNSGPKFKGIYGSFNIRGLGNKDKLRHLISVYNTMLKTTQNFCMCLQETYLTDEYLGLLWRGHLVFSPGTRHGITLLSSNIHPKKIEHIEEGRGHLILVESNDGLGLICNLYAPNGFYKHKSKFF